MENTPHTKYTKIMLLGLVAILLVASTVGYMVSQNMNSKQKGSDNTQINISPTIAPTLIPYPVQGALTLKEKSGQSIKIGSPFTIDVYATSSKDTVAGYDVVLSFDTSSLDSQSIQSTADAFRIFTYKRTNHISVSGTKNLSITEPVRFTNTPILSFTFIATKKGSYTFSLKPVGNESSKLVNEAAAVTYPETNDIRLEIN